MADAAEILSAAGPAMETVGKRLAEAQQSGDLTQVKKALHDAKAAGVPAEQIEEGLREVDRLQAMIASNAREAQALEASRAEAKRAEALSGAPGDAQPPGPAEKAAAEAAAADARIFAEAHKKRGNECLKNNTKSAAKDALECFTTGLEVRCDDNVLNAQLYGNRAHVRLLLRQYVEAVDDCRKAIELDPRNLKSYWRGAKASMQLDLMKNGFEFCEAGLEQNPQDADLLRLKETCAEKLAGMQKRKTELSASRGDFNADEAMAVQEQITDLSNKVEILKGKMGYKQRERARADITRTAIAETPADTGLYKSVGRCFLSTERASLEQALTSTIEQADTELPSLLNTCKEMENRKEAAEKELKEMVHAFRKQTDGQAGGGS